MIHVCHEISAEMEFRFGGVSILQAVSVAFADETEQCLDSGAIFKAAQADSIMFLPTVVLATSATEVLSEVFGLAL
jgi:hypothetical protein